LLATCSCYKMETSFSLVRKPRIQTQPCDHLNVKLGSKIRFEVQTAGDGECRWIHNGSIVKNNYRITGSESKCLIIWMVHKEDEGTIKFIVSNELGQDISRTAILTISSKLFECINRQTVSCFTSC